ncbi:hypothetical protein [Nocardia nepalensis]|uniref:hypothetical protein n=1 Tax=Nocardia nepalensis TaxID=3375448 RepID=UPI003B683558
MKGGTKIAIGVGIGYVLGRTRKMRFAMALAGAALAKRSSDVPGELLERGTSLLRSSPEVAQLADTVRGELVGAVRSAAVAAASNRIDALNTRLQQGSTFVSDTAQDQSRETGETGESSTDEDEDLEDQTDSGTDRGDQEDREQPAARARTARPRTARARKTVSRTSDRRSGSAASSVRRRSRADTDEAPVRRTKR